ncbi:MAG: TspO/MBR family protein [Muribaculaceae bacterium]|nr:TspO/MBR family protein [Muribaculaceae bacterium]
MKRFLWILLAIAICFAVGYTARVFQADSLAEWYPLLEKPGLTPPDSVFPIAWGIIYVCMGISIGLISNELGFRRNPLISLFVMQLALNFLWSISFFYMMNPMLGFINILLLDIVVLMYTFNACKVNRLSAWLFLPYILWLAFATYLNGYIYMYN